MAIPYTNFEQDISSREKDIQSAYSQMRKSNLASRDATRRRTMRDLAQQEAAQGSFGGAGLKMRQQAATDIERGFSAEDAGIGAQESAALQQLKGEATGQRFQAEEAQKQRDLAESQFGRTLEFQQNSFADQMRFNWAEFDENRKTNFVNAMIAMKDAGLNSPKEWNKLFESTVAKGLYKGSFFEKNAKYKPIPTTYEPNW